ncbi:MAG TPA: DUF4256 domain-containing protein, partial [Candidatus Gracilibacteria bacterium]|nr:DUF4256 domain-containing protein [Candidatus Gracilibacteria bacterium]
TKNLINTIVKRFENNMLRHETEDSRHLRSHLERKAIEKPEKIWSLNEMERTGGEPDVRCYDEERDEYVFWDFSKETPEGRKRVCYDHDAEKEAYLLYKEYITNGIEPPRGNAVDRAAAMGVELMTTEEYRTFLIMENDDSIDEFPGSWLETPAKTRRYGKAFIGQGEDDFPLDLIEPFEFLDEPGFRVTLRV